MFLSRLSTDFIRFYNRVRNDIFSFAKALNFEPTEQQIPLLAAAQALAYYGLPTHVACKSGQGPGKTAVSVIIGLWRAFRNVGALTVVTAPTMRQAKEVWLAEARSRIMQGHSEIRKFFEVRATEIEICGVHDWGVKLASASKPENMQGWHNKHLSFIVDEASGVARNIIETIMGTLTNVDKLFLQIGNPNTRDSSFFDAFNRDRSKWHTITLNAEDSPIVDKQNLLRLEELYGRESDVYRVRVLGEFPNQDPNTVMNSDDLEACAANNMIDRLKAGRGKQFGIDLARFGDDASVVYRRSGLAIVENKIIYKAEPDKILASAFEMQRQARWRNEECLYVVDAGGIGQGVMPFLYNSHRRVHEFHFGGSPGDGAVYHDKVSEAFFGMGERVKRRELYIPNDPQLISELSNRQYALTAKGKIKVESKDEYRKRIQDGSPDRADAAIMSFYEGCTVGSRMAG